MEERIPHEISEDHANDALAEKLAERRRQALDLAQAGRQQLEQFDAAIESHFAQIERCLSAFAGADGHAPADLGELAELMEREAAEMARRREQLAVDQADLAARQAELKLSREQVSRDLRELTEREAREHEGTDHRAAELRAAESRIKHAEHDLQAAHEAHQSEARQLAHRRQRVEEQHLQLEKEVAELEARREDTRTQRRRLAGQLKVERAAVIHERELNRAELERQRAGMQKEIERHQTQLREDREAFEQQMSRAKAQLQRDRQQCEEETALLDEARRQVEEARRQSQSTRDVQSGELAAARQDVQRLTAQLAESKREAAAAAERSERLERDIEALRREAAERPAASAVDPEAMAKAEQARLRLVERVEQLETELAAAQKRMAEQPETADPQRMEDLQRRFEMAVDDVRQLKRRNAELEEQLAARPAGDKRSSPDGRGVATDWESTKRRMLAELENEQNHSDSERMSHEDRLTVEGAIRITDQMVIERDREIAELKQLLEQQGGASDHDVAQLLDRDETIQIERQRLLALQQEWQEKLRGAEVEISVHRARIAREKAEVEEKLRQLEAEKASQAARQAAGLPPSSGPDTGPKRRWLARLGLKEGDKE